MLIGLSDRLWERIEPAMTNITKDKYDMDLVNDLLSDTVLMLPGNFISINSHWETWGIPKWYIGDIKPAATSATKAVVSATVVAGRAVELFGRMRKFRSGISSRGEIPQGVTHPPILTPPCLLKMHLHHQSSCRYGYFPSVNSLKA